MNKLTMRTFVVDRRLGKRRLTRRFPFGAGAPPLSSTQMIDVVGQIGIAVGWDVRDGQAALRDPGEQCRFTLWVEEETGLDDNGRQGLQRQPVALQEADGGLMQAVAANVEGDQEARVNQQMGHESALAGFAFPSALSRYQPATMVLAACQSGAALAAAIALSIAAYMAG
jgi:hypothetical protein